MSASNRLQVAAVRETTAGTTPTTPRMRLVRLTGESLNFTPNYINSDELRSDRMLPDPIKVMQASDGGVNFELFYPVDLAPMSEFIRSAFFNTWVNTPQRDNDGTADSVITDVASGTSTITFTTGDAFVAGHLVRRTGFTNSGNNGVSRVTTGGATSIVVNGSLTNETAPPATARIKVVGIQGANGDISATASGLNSAASAFSGKGFVVGMWVKIGGTLTGDQFATGALNTWVRVTAVSASDVTFDNLPAAWTTDAGTGKTIRVFFGDHITNGTTATSLSIEKGFLDQTTPTYIVNTGMQVNTMSFSVQSRQKITGSVSFTGMGGSQSTTALDASPDAASTGAVMAANANVGRIAENGSTLTSPNWASRFELQINNNLRTLESVDSTSPVDVQAGECAVSGTIDTYFGSNTLLAKLYAGTASSISARYEKNSQALIFQVPRVTFTGGNPAAAGKNQDIILPLAFQASIDTTYTNAHVVLDRLEYYE